MSTPAQNVAPPRAADAAEGSPASAGEILKRCDGARTVGEIVADLETAFGATNLTDDVTSFLSFAVTKHWLEVAE